MCDGLLAGTDIWDSTYELLHTAELAKYENDPVIVYRMRQATHRIMYMVANSSAMNGISPTTKIEKVTPWWQMAIYIVDVTFVILTIFSALMLVKNIMCISLLGMISSTISS